MNPKLADFLDSDAHDGLDAPAAYGFLCAAALVPMEKTARHALFFDDTDAPDWVKDALDDELANISETLACDERVNIPFDDEDLQSFCAGFVDYMYGGQDWFLLGDEEEIAMLTLPMLAISGVIDDDDEMSALMDDPDTMSDFADSLSDNLTELYLLFHDKDA